MVNLSEETVLPIAVAAIVALPILLGWALGHIPRQTALAILVPTVLFAGLSVVGERAMRARGKGAMQALVSAAFGLFWVLCALSATKREDARLRKFRWMFLAFGVTWIAITLYQYYANETL